MKIVVDLNDASYYEKRAIECIQEAESIRLTKPEMKGSELIMVDAMYHHQLNKAIQLLALARITEE